MFETRPLNPAINPAYAAIHPTRNVQYAKLPAAPITASPVPHLTSLYHFDFVSPRYGNRSYPGNCGGELIKDLLSFFQPQSVFDPMSGSGTCRDVCDEMGIACQSTDLKQGFDATSPDAYDGLGPFEFIWAHPPYWRMKVYSDSPNDLSQCKTLEEFLKRYGRFIGNCANVLASGGRFAVLMGDYSDRRAGFVPLTYYTKQLSLEAGLALHGTDIIRFSHSASSSRKAYRSSFIPGLHDVCAIFTKPTR